MRKPRPSKLTLHPSLCLRINTIRLYQSLFNPRVLCRCPKLTNLETRPIILGPARKRRCQLQTSFTKRLRDLSREKNTFPGTLVLEKTGTDASHLLRPWAQIRNAPSPTAVNPQDPKPQTHRHHRQAQEVMRGQRTDPLTTSTSSGFRVLRATGLRA